MLLLVYVAIPILSSYFMRNRGSRYLSYILSAGAVALFPFALFTVRDWIFQPEPGPRCMTPEATFIIGNFIFFLPLTLVFQFLCNLVIKRKPQPTE